MAKTAKKRSKRTAKKEPTPKPTSTEANFVSYVVHKRLVFELQDYLTRTGKGKSLLDAVTGAEVITVGSREFPGFAITDLAAAQAKALVKALGEQVKWLTTERRAKRLNSLGTALERMALQTEQATA